jgi:chromosome segregation ATPase
MGVDQLFGKSYVLSNITTQPSNVFEQLQQVHTYYQAKNGELCTANNELKSRLSYVEQALASERVLRSAATSHLRNALEKLKDSQKLVDTLKKQCQKHQESLDKYQLAEASKQHTLENANNSAQNLIEIEKDPSEPDLQRTIRQQQRKIAQFKDQLIATINCNRILNKELERLESTSDIHNLHKSVIKELTSLRADLTQQTTNVGMLCNQLQTMVQCNDELRAVLSGHNAVINEMIQPFKDIAVSKEGRRFLKEFEIECTHGGRKLDLTCLVRVFDEVTFSVG